LETSLCSKFYNQIIKDDHGWRLAFLKRFKTLPLVRMGSDYKEEYLSRLELISWGKQGLNQVTIPTPLTDSSTMHLFSKQTLLLGSVNDGFLTQLDPLTGKRGREDLWISDDGDAIRTSCLLIDGSRAWIGLLNGSVLGSYYSKAKWQDWKILRDANLYIVTKFKRIKDCNLVLFGISDGSVEIMDWANTELVGVLRGGSSNSVEFIDYSNKFVVFGGSTSLFVSSYNIFNKHDTALAPKAIILDSMIKGVWMDDIQSCIICWTVNSITQICLKSFTLKQILSNYFTAVAYLESSTSVLCTGDELGAISIWKILGDRCSIVKQISCHTSPISCLSFTPEVLLSASCDGDINMFDGICFSLLRFLGRKRRPHPDLDRLHLINFRWDYLLFKSGCVIAGRRDSITSFARRPPKKPVSAAKSKKIRVSFGRSSGQTSNRDKEDVHYEISQVLEELEEERIKRHHALGRVEKSNGTMHHHGMSENELIEYAKVLSVADPHSIPLSNATDQENLDLAIVLSLSLSEQRE
jgi:WD40 repeat protein